MNWTRRLALLAVPMVLAACAYTRLQSPELSVVDISLLRADLLRQDLRVRMRVYNPNDRELPVRSINYEVELAGRSFAHGDSLGDFVVPARGDTEFEVNVTTNAAGALLRMLTTSEKGSTEYRIRGKVQLSSGMLRTIPFDHSGQLQLD